MKLPKIYNNSKLVEWVEPINFDESMIDCDDIDLKDYKNFYKIGTYKKSNILYDEKSNNLYLQLDVFFTKDLWIKINNKDNNNKFKKEINNINKLYFNDDDFDNIKENIYYIGLVPDFTELENMMVEYNPFTQNEFKQKTKNNEKHINRLSIINTKYSNSSIELYYFNIVNINDSCPCYIKVIYNDKFDDIPVDLEGSISLLSIRNFYDFTKEITNDKSNNDKSNNEHNDMHWSILLPALLLFDQDLFMDKAHDDKFLSSKPKTNKLLSIILDLLE